MLLQQSTGRAEIGVETLRHRHLAICRQLNSASVIEPTESEQQSILGRLTSSAIIAHAATVGCLRLKVEVEDVKLVVREEELLKHLFPQ